LDQIVPIYPTNFDMQLDNIIWTENPRYMAHTCWWNYVFKNMTRDI
jgi:hypothetical protein